MVGRPIQISGSGRKTLQHVQKWSGGPPKCPGVFGRPSLMSLSGRKPFWMFGSCREALRISGRPSRLSGSGREALPDVQKWSGGPPGCPGVVGWPSQMFESGRMTIPNVREWSEALPDVRVWSGVPSGCPEVVGGLPEVREWSSVLPNVREWSGGPPKSPGVFGCPSRMSGSGRETLSDVRE